MKEEELYRVIIPDATESYAPVSHRNIINAVREQLDIHNLNTTKETFSTARFGQQLIGYMDINRDDNLELGMRLVFRNSYDKSMSVAIAAGSCVWICTNGVVAGEIQYIRKHTGSVVQELNHRVVNAINSLNEHFDLVVEHSNRMKEIEVNPRLSAELAGRLFIEEDLITSQQLNIVKKEIINSSYPSFKEPTLWSFYNHVTNSLKESHPYTYMQKHVNLHRFVETEFELV